MHNTTCLNCTTEIDGKFCSECGQKSDTHRITAKHFFMHDLLHGVLHVDKGIPFTLKQLFIRPGFAARDYISGKRVQYYNVFYLMFIVLGLIIIVTNRNEELSIFYAGMIRKRPNRLPY